jgi:hypothetical protein
MFRVAMASAPTRYTSPGRDVSVDMQLFEELRPGESNVFENAVMVVFKSSDYEVLRMLAREM